MLAVGQDNLSYDIAAIELNASGTPISTAGGVTQGGVAPGSFYPRVASRGSVAPQWGLSFSRGYTALGAQFVSTGDNGWRTSDAPERAAASAPTPAPPPPRRPSACPTPIRSRLWRRQLCQRRLAVPDARYGAARRPTGTRRPEKHAPAPTPTPDADAKTTVKKKKKKKKGRVPASTPLPGAVCDGGWPAARGRAVAPFWAATAAGCRQRMSFSSGCAGSTPPGTVTFACGSVPSSQAASEASASDPPSPGAIA